MPAFFSGESRWPSQPHFPAQQGSFSASALTTLSTRHTSYLQFLSRFRSGSPREAFSDHSFLLIPSNINTCNTFPLFSSKNKLPEGKRTPYLPHSPNAQDTAW